jgi:hypothetical protein
VAEATLTPGSAAPRRTRAWAVFPLLLIAVTVVLGSLRLSGSSTSLLVPGADDSGLLAGQARAVRTDEWLVRTPLAARQSQLDLPGRDLIGVGRHDTAIGNDLPTAGWEVLVRPHTLPYHVFGIERAFAFEWWTVYLALPAIGLYALALALGVRIPIASLAALIVVLSPVVQWWTVPFTGTSIGYATLAGAALLAATRARSIYARVALSAACGWLGACLVLVLYPPWAVPMFLLVGVVTAVAIATSYPSREARRAWWLRVLTVTGVAAAAGGALLLAFIHAHRGAIDALSNTVYPGQRRSGGGNGSFAALLGAPFDLVESTRSAAQVPVNGLNQSEAAAGLFTLLAIAVAIVVDRATSAWKPWRSRIVLLTLLGVGGIFVVWYLLPVPSGIGRLLLLDRVRSDRMLLPLAVAGALALGVLVEIRRRRDAPSSAIGLVAGTAAFAVPTLWAGLTLEVAGHTASRWQVLLLAAISTVGVALALSGRVAGLWVLAALFAAGALTVNPLQQGLAPLVDSPAARLGRQLAARRDTGTVLQLFAQSHGYIGSAAGLAASGVPLLSGVNNYPDATAWRVLDPDGSSRRAWNRYSIPVWTPGPPGSAPRFEVHPPADLTMTIDPCDPRLGRLAVRTIVSDQPLTRSCLTEIMRTGDPQRLYAYRIEH